MFNFMDNQRLPASKFGLVEKINTSSFEMRSLVQWVFQRWYLGLGETNITNSEMRVLAKWNAFNFETWVWRDSRWNCWCGTGNKYFQLCHLCFEDNNKLSRPLHPLGPRGRPYCHDWNCFWYYFRNKHYTTLSKQNVYSSQNECAVLEDTWGCNLEHSKTLHHLVQSKCVFVTPFLLIMWWGHEPPSCSDRENRKPHICHECM